MGALIQLELYTMSKPQKKIMVYVLAQSLLPFNLKLPVVKIVSLSLWGLTQAIHTLV